MARSGPRRCDGHHKFCDFRPKMCETWDMREAEWGLPNAVACPLPSSGDGIVTPPTSTLIGAETEHQNHCRSAQPMSLMGQNRRLPQRNNNRRFTSDSGHHRHRGCKRLWVPRTGWFNAPRVRIVSRAFLATEFDSFSRRAGATQYHGGEVAARGLHRRRLAQQFHQSVNAVTNGRVPPAS
jgi:hypothetical protein